MDILAWIVGALFVGFFLGFIAGMGIISDEATKWKKCAMKCKRRYRELEHRSRVQSGGQ